MKRGSIRKRDATLITIWFPKPIETAINTAVTRHDSDRSKYIRSAVREKLLRDGILVKEAAR